jgi:hypothetical protein
MLFPVPGPPVSMNMPQDIITHVIGVLFCQSCLLGCIVEAAPFQQPTRQGKSLQRTKTDLSSLLWLFTCLRRRASAPFTSFVRESQWKNINLYPKP